MKARNPVAATDAIKAIDQTDLKVKLFLSAFTKSRKEIRTKSEEAKITGKVTILHFRFSSIQSAKFLISPADRTKIVNSTRIPRSDNAKAMNVNTKAPIGKNLSLF